MYGADQLKTVVRETPWLMEALVVARDVRAPDWLIGGGVIRTVVWDRLHDFGELTPLAESTSFFRPDRPLA